MAKIIIDNKEYDANPSKNLLETCLSLGFDLPYFCWHPAMDSVGACRQCAVKKYKDDKDEKGKIVMSCLEPVQEGDRVSIYDKEVVEFRAGVIEWLMTNHPHDCPVCDEGGECHLQDMTVMTGHSYRRFDFKKRTYVNQNLGPFIHHEMNRCIQCYRCERFYKDYAGGEDFGAFAAHNNVYFGRAEEGTLENEFSGNLVEVCPTGVFTDKTLRKHYTRKWDLTNAPSICTHCGLGCNIITGERYGSIRRVLSRYNGEVNGYFICDRGRFGYEFMNSDKRIKKPVIKNKETKQLTLDSLTQHVADVVSNSKGVIGIGSPRASLESNYLLQKLVGKNNFCSGISNQEQILLNEIVNIIKNGSARTPSLKGIEKADAILILGEDLTNSAPMMALAVRQAVRKKGKEIAQGVKIPEWHEYAVKEVAQKEGNPLYITSLRSTKLDKIAKNFFHASPDQISKLGFSIANIIDSNSPHKVVKSDKASGNDAKQNQLASAIASDLLNAKHPLIISGTSCGSESVIHAAANISWALKKKGKNAEISFTVPEANSIGVTMLSGRGLGDTIENKSDSDTLIILENDLYRRDPEEKIDSFLSKFKEIIVLDSLENPTTNKANVVIPVGAFAETDGTFINNECRAQRYYQAYSPDDLFILESWKYLGNILNTIGKEESSSSYNFYDCLSEISSTIDEFKEIKNIAPPPEFREAGQKIPREPHRFSGRTAMRANINVSEPKPPLDSDSPMSFTMEGYRGLPPSPLIPFFWSPGWNSAQSINKFQIEVGGPLHGGDPGKRIFEPKENAEVNYFTDIPERADMSRKHEDFLIVPINFIFGSGELSSLSPSVAQRIPKPYIFMNPVDIEKHNVHSDSIRLEVGSIEIELPVKEDSSIPEGIIGLPVGFSDMEYVELPAMGKISGAKR